MTWIYTHVELAIFFAGAIFAVIGYYYRAWRDQQNNLREALYLLLEIWHRNSMCSASTIDRLFEMLIEQFKVRYPHLPFADEDAVVARGHVLSIINKQLHIAAMDGIESLHAGYSKVIQLISRSDPLLAYDLDSASQTKKRLVLIDQYVQEVLQPLLSEEEHVKVFSDTLRCGVNANLEKDTIDDLETNLRRLATKLGPITLIKVSIRISRRKKLLANGPQPEEFDQLVDQALLPAIAAMQTSFDDAQHGKLVETHTK